MNIELKPIAESKVRQLGGDVCGVLVRTDDSEVIAVSEHGRCTRLDAGVMGPVEPSGMNDTRNEFERIMANQAVLSWSDSMGEYRSVVTQKMWEVWQAARAQGGQGAELDEYQKFDQELCQEVFEKLNAEFDKDPKGGITVYTEDWRASVHHLKRLPAVPEGLSEAIKATADKLEKVEGESADGGYMWDARECAEFIREEADKLSTPTTPQADEWVRCDERLPTEEDCWVWIYDSEDSDIFHALWRDLKGDYENGHMNLSHWMPTGLKRPQPPKEGE